MYLAVGGRISYTPNVERIVCWTMCKLCHSVLKTLFLFRLHHAHMRKIPGSPHVHVCILEQGSLGTIQLSKVPSGLITFRSLCMIPSLCAQHPPPLTPPPLLLQRSYILSHPMNVKNSEKVSSRKYKKGKSTKKLTTVTMPI